MLEDTASKPTAAFIGLPPKYHGALEDPEANIEVSTTLQPSKLWKSQLVFVTACI